MDRIYIIITLRISRLITIESFVDGVTLNDFFYFARGRRKQIRFSCLLMQHPSAFIQDNISLRGRGALTVFFFGGGGALSSKMSPPLLSRSKCGSLMIFVLDSQKRFRATNQVIYSMFM